MSIWTVSFFLSQILAVFVLIIRLKKRPENIKQRKNRQLIYVFLCALFLAPVGAIGIVTRDNWLVLIFALDFMMLSYYLLVWVRLITNPGVSNKLIVRPIAAMFIIVIVAFELTIVATSGDAFNVLAIGIPDEAVSNFWLFIGIIVPTIYITVCVALFVYEIIKAAALVNDTLNQEGLYLKYRYIYMAVIFGFMLAFIALCSFGLCIYLFTKSKQFYDATVSVRDIVLGVAIIGIVFVTVRNANLFEKYKNYQNKRIENYLRQLEVFYNQTIKLFPASFTSNAYQYAEINSNAWVISSVVKTLTDIRIRLWRAEAQRLAILRGVSVSTVRLPTKATIKQDVEVWNNFTKNLEQSVQAKVLLKQIGRVVVDIPSFEGVHNPDNIEQLANYYIRLLKELEILETNDSLNESRVV